MSFAAEHYFWQQRVDREIGARNKYDAYSHLFFRFIENNFLKTKQDTLSNYGPDRRIT